jgi:N-[(2S)-2-amino-2-carboxyethyl]-L-glutamate dehydrogenase
MRNGPAVILVATRSETSKRGRQAIVSDNIRVLGRSNVEHLLQGREQDVLESIRSAYEAHALGRTVVPHSLFLTFPRRESDRIIALPAYLETGGRWAGIKWISSFPANINKGQERASAILALNSLENGRVVALMEASVINAWRTAASAALAATTLHSSDGPTAVGLVGAGPINGAIAHFLSSVYPSALRYVVIDPNRQRAAALASKLEGETIGAATEIRPHVESGRLPQLISVATNVSTPYIGNTSNWPDGSTILHISLRDITANIIRDCDNVVDDIDHVCRGGTSVHLAEEFVGNRGFIRTTIGEVLLGKAPARVDAMRHLIFSPFGLGALDVAIAALVYDAAIKRGVGTEIEGFFSNHTEVE